MIAVGPRPFPRNLRGIQPPPPAPKRQLTPEQKQAIEDVREAAYREKMLSDVVAWCKHVLKPIGQTPAPHHLLILRELAKVASGENDRLLINMPPGAAKSTYASVLFAAWYIATHPHSNILAVSYGSELVENFSARVRDLIAEYTAELGVSIVKGKNAVGQWTTTNGCTYRAVGAGGAITGFRADLVIADDLIKSREEAYSDSSRNTLWSWLASDLFTRLKSNARVVMIGTRWHLDDLSGRLLELEPERWRLIKIPALAEENDPLDRPPDEKLQSWLSYQELAELRTKLGEMEWSALYQQRPVPSGGSLFRANAIRLIESAALQTAKIIRGYDLAATARGDWTASVKIARLPDGSYIILDVTRMRGTPDEVDAHILQNAALDGEHVLISLPRDPGQAGIYQQQHHARLLAGYRVSASPETGSKQTRAAIVAAQVNSGNVSMLRGDWNRIFLEELSQFPAGRWDDQVDALSRAFSQVIGPPKIAFKGHINIFGR